MNKFYNGKDVTKENLIFMIKEVSADNWKNSDLNAKTKNILEKIAYEDYDGRDEDIQFIIDKLNAKTNLFGDGKYLYEHKDANLQNVEVIISEGEWYFQKYTLTSLLQEMQNGNRVFLHFDKEQTDGECTWNNEEWSFDGEYYVCGYDGEGSTRHDEDDMEFDFNFELTDRVDIRP